MPYLVKQVPVATREEVKYLLELIAYLQCAQTYWWGYEAASRYGGSDRLADVQAPTLFLSPLGGLPFVVERTRRAHEAMPGSRFREIDGTTEVCMEDPETWASAVLDFFREVDAERAGTAVTTAVR